MKDIKILRVKKKYLALQISLIVTEPLCRGSYFLTSKQDINIISMLFHIKDHLNLMIKHLCLDNVFNKLCIQYMYLFIMNLLQDKLSFWQSDFFAIIKPSM